MTEERIGEHGIIESGGIHLHQVAPTAAGGVEGFGEQLLAGAGFAGNEHRFRCRRYRLDECKGPLHPPAAGHDADKCFGVPDFVGQQAFAQTCVAAGEPPHLYGSLQATDEPAGLDRLDHVVEGSRLHAAYRRIDVIAGGHDYDRDLRIELADPSQKHIPRDIRHCDVKENGLDFDPLQKGHHLP